MASTTQIKKPQNSLIRPFVAFLRRFHLLLFFVFVVACLSAAVVLINKTLTETPEAPYSSPITAGSIDQATLERLDSLHPSSEPSPPPALPPGRINPFAE
jgi:hypothetical protein